MNLQVQDLSRENQSLSRDKKKKQRKIEDLIMLYTDTQKKLRKTLLVLGLETEEEDKSVCQADQSSKNNSSQFMSVEKKRDN